MRLSDSLEKKYNCLKDVIEGYEKVGVAFSGGIDSTLLLFVAHQVLGSDRITGYHVSSCLQTRSLAEQNKTLLDKISIPQSSFVELTAFPLYWKEFVANDTERCYFCKKRIYKTILDDSINKEIHDLLDGTNLDDLKQSRPGLRAIRELGIKTPLVQCKFTKHEIRHLARHLNLPNHDLPSNSCLATRIETGQPINEKTLKLIEESELFLVELGFYGCRVKPRGAYTIVEVQCGDLGKFVDRTNLLLIQRKMLSMGLGKLLLDMEGR